MGFVTSKAKPDYTIGSLPSARDYAFSDPVTNHAPESGIHQRILSERDSPRSAQSMAHDVPPNLAPCFHPEMGRYLFVRHSTIKHLRKFCAWNSLLDFLITEFQFRR
jgi:hypothetical protein